MPKGNTAQSLSCNPIKNGITQPRFTEKARESQVIKSMIKPHTWENCECLLHINNCTKHTRTCLEAQLDFVFAFCGHAADLAAALQTPISVHTGVVQIPQFPGELAWGWGGWRRGSDCFPPPNLHLTSHLAPTAPPRSGAQGSLQLSP